MNGWQGQWPGGNNPWGSWAGGRGRPVTPPWVNDLVRSFGGPVGGGGARRGPKARRGDVRAAILSVLAEEAMNGYQVIQQIAERSEGAWKPSRSEEHTSELQSLMRISYAVFCLKKKKTY